MPFNIVYHINSICYTLTHIDNIKESHLGETTDFGSLLKNNLFWLIP